MNIVEETHEYVKDIFPIVFNTKKDDPYFFSTINFYLEDLGIAIKKNNYFAKNQSERTYTAFEVIYLNDVVFRCYDSYNISENMTKTYYVDKITLYGWIEPLSKCFTMYLENQLPIVKDDKYIISNKIGLNESDFSDVNNFNDSNSSIGVDPILERSYKALYKKFAKEIDKYINN